MQQFFQLILIMSTIGFWIKNSRSVALPQSLLPCLTAIVLCIGQEGFVWWLCIPILLGVAATHLGMNLADDYFDYKHDSHLRSDITGKSVRARMEKCHYLVPKDGQQALAPGERKATIDQLGWAVVAFLSFAGVMGGIAFATQWIIHGWQAAIGIFLYAGLGLFIGINYAGKPLELGYHGLGELVIGTIFGPLLMLGVQTAMTGNIFTWPMLCLSVGVGCMVTNIVYVHSVMEVHADAQMGKMTFARLLNGKGESSLWGKRLMIIFIGIFALMPFVMLGIGIYLGWWSPWFLATLITLPMSIYLIHSTRLFAFDLPRTDKPRWWMGPMGDWDTYVKIGMDWFLYRWLLARNICTFFCLVLMITHIVMLFTNSTN